MLPILTPKQMAAVDRAAPEPVEELIARAGWHVARAARRMLAGVYGRRVAVIAGKGNNGADGRVAAAILRRWGVRCQICEPGDPIPRGVDLVIDAAYGTGLRDPWPVPEQPIAPVLAVDIPSGVDGLTGADLGSLRAEHTVTFAALKPGLLLHPGAARTTTWEVADIGLDVGSPTAWLVEDRDMASTLVERSPTAHKWNRGVRVIAGSPGMSGAGWLTARGAQRAGAGMVVVSTPGVPADQVNAPVEAVARDLPAEGWAAQVLDDIDRFDCLVAGPGLGRDDAMLAELMVLLDSCPVPTVLDADGLAIAARWPQRLRAAPSPVVLTPHDGEYSQLTGRPPGVDRPAAARALAEDLDCVVLLKGATTLVAAPDAQLRYVVSGSPLLATAGTGDVLSGVVGAVADSTRILDSVALAAHWHGRAGSMGSHGLVASDVADLLPAARRAMVGE